MIDIKNNQIAVAGADFFADAEGFLNELTDSEMLQVQGVPSVTTLTEDQSGLSLLLCG